MRSLSLYLFFVFSPIIYSNGQITKCEKTSPCSCVSDAGVISLGPIAAQGTIRFQDILSPSGDMFSWNPCLPFTEGDCRNVAACQITNAQSASYFNTGTQDSAQFSVSNGVVQISYSAYNLDSSGKNISRKTIVSLECDAGEDSGSLTVQGDSSDQPGIYMMTLRSAHACPLTEATPATVVPIHNETGTIVPFTLATHTHIVPISLVTHNHKTGPTGNPATLSPPNHIPDPDIADIKLLLVGQVVMLAFIMILLLILMLIFGYRVCQGGKGSRSSYDNL